MMIKHQLDITVQESTVTKIMDTLNRIGDVKVTLVDEGWFRRHLEIELTKPADVDDVLAMGVLIGQIEAMAHM